MRAQASADSTTRDEPEVGAALNGQCCRRGCHQTGQPAAVSGREKFEGFALLAALIHLHICLDLRRSESESDGQSPHQVALIDHQKPHVDQEIVT
jgi:hypothetical protein